MLVKTNRRAVRGACCRGRTAALPAVAASATVARRRPGGDGLRVGWAEVREVSQQVVVWPDELCSGLPVDHEDHAGGEDVVGQDPAVGVMSRPGAVVMQ